MGNDSSTVETATSPQHYSAERLPAGKYLALLNMAFAFGLLCCRKRHGQTSVSELENIDILNLSEKHRLCYPFSIIVSGLFFPHWRTMYWAASTNRYQVYSAAVALTLQY